MWYIFLIVVAIPTLVAPVLAQTSATAAAAATTIDNIDVNVANVPDCAKVCLSNSTQYATDCAQIDVKCLCNSPSYVSALSCCLATNCNAVDQQTAIQFNIQECAAVNSTAPNFVGCSPFSLTTGSSRATSTSAGDGIGTTTISDFAMFPSAYTNTKIGTANFAGGSLLTQSCTMPWFAQVTQSAGDVVQFPEVGCALNRDNCCPYEPSDYLGLTKCPSDYATVSGGCCPSGYSVYFSSLGAETPCYSKPTKTYLPATTATGSQVSVITDMVFSRRFSLVQKAGPQLPPGAIAGITIGSALAAATPFFLVWLLRSIKQSKANVGEGDKDKTGATFPTEDPTIDTVQTVNEAPAATKALSPHELASPNRVIDTPKTFKSVPFSTPSFRSPSSPPAYEVPAAIPLEMPGSTYIHEHHPAFGGQESEINPRTPPKSPPASPGITASTRSPILSPSSPFRAGSPGNTNSILITPLGSPRFREDTT